MGVIVTYSLNLMRHRKRNPSVSIRLVLHLSNVANFAAIVGDVEVPHFMVVKQKAPRRGVIEA